MGLLVNNNNWAPVDLSVYIIGVNVYSKSHIDNEFNVLTCIL